MDMQLRGAILYVKDLERMKRFYGEMLGATPTNEGLTDAWASFEAGGARFSLHAIPAAIGKSIAIKSPPLPREENPVKLIFEVKDVEAERSRLESLGIKRCVVLGRKRVEHAMPLILRATFSKSFPRPVSDMRIYRHLGAYALFPANPIEAAPSERPGEMHF